MFGRQAASIAASRRLRHDHVEFAAVAFRLAPIDAQEMSRDLEGRKAAKDEHDIRTGRGAGDRAAQARHGPKDPGDRDRYLCLRAATGVHPVGETRN
jgi:hypothetical protein